MYKISGEEIPSVINDEYICEEIQFYDIELQNIKDAQYLASVYQNLIKSYCVFRMYDWQYEMYSLVVKWLKRTDGNQIIIEYNILTGKYLVELSDNRRNHLMKHLDYTEIKNKTNKVNLYKGWYCRVYMIMNERAYSNTGHILDGDG